MFDSSDRLLVCNQRFVDLYGLSPEIVRPGCSHREILDHRVAAGSICADDIEQNIVDVHVAVDKGTTFSRLTCLSDGRIISIVNNPMEGGWCVATHEDVTEAKRAEERISYEAHVDALTGLPNRKAFYEHIDDAFKYVQRGERLAVLYLNLDHLKRVNDTLGHPAGDKLLKDVADRLSKCAKNIELVARLSGDEFAIVQTGLDSPDDAAALSKRVLEAIHEPFDLDGHQILVDISIGIAIAPTDATELDELLKAADIALYEAKNTRARHLLFL